MEGQNLSAWLASLACCHQPLALPLCVSPATSNILSVVGRDLPHPESRTIYRGRGGYRATRGLGEKLVLDEVDSPSITWRPTKARRYHQVEGAVSACRK